jgi:hypothetical protein
LGYYALLWITGPGGDFLNAARYLPSAVLPREFHLREVKLPASNEVTSETARALDVTAADEQPVSRETALSPDEAGEKELDPDAGPQASEVIEIVGAPSFSADELAVALSKAKEAQAGLVTGNFVDGGEVKRTKAQSYMAFCDLAQKATFVDMASNASYASALERDVEELCRTTLADAHAQGELTHLVPLWIKSRKRTHAGIFLAGRIANQADKGSVAEFQLDIGSGEPLTVLVSQEQAGAVASSAWPLAVLGWIVDQPAENVHGYTGDAPQDVWAGKFIDLE